MQPSGDMDKHGYHCGKPINITCNKCQPHGYMNPWLIIKWVVVQALRLHDTMQLCAAQKLHDACQDCKASLLDHWYAHESLSGYMTKWPHTHTVTWCMGKAAIIVTCTNQRLPLNQTNKYLYQIPIMEVQINGCRHFPLPKLSKLHSHLRDKLSTAKQTPAKQIVHISTLCLKPK